MSEVQLLKNKLAPLLNWHGARIDFLAKFLIAIIKVSTVNLTHIAAAFSGKAETDSNYKRIYRFLKDFTIDFDLIASIIAGLFLPPGEKWLLTIDRSNWKFGKKNINFLVLGACYKGMAIPLFWSLLPKRGNSNAEERLAVMERFLKVFGADKIEYLTGDREFIGKFWIAYLQHKLIKFVIRIRHDAKIPDSKGQQKHARDFFRDLKSGEARLLSRRRIWRLHFSVAGQKLSSGEYLILATSESMDDAFEIYARRWEIETLFGCLKTRGFNFESTHLTDPERLSKLFALVALSACWAHKAGELKAELKAIKIKKHKRKAKSIFRNGLDYLRQILNNIGAWA